MHLIQNKHKEDGNKSEPNSGESRQTEDENQSNGTLHLILILIILACLLLYNCYYLYTLINFEDPESEPKSGGKVSTWN